MNDIRLFDVNPQQAIYTRVYDILDTYNHWDMLDYTIEDLKRDIKNNPLDVLNALADIIEDL